MCSNNVSAISYESYDGAERRYLLLQLVLYIFAVCKL